MFELIIILMLSGAVDAASEPDLTSEYCDTTVWGRWCDPDQDQLTLDWQARKFEPHTQPEIEGLIFGID